MRKKIKIETRKEKRERRHRRVRAKIFGTEKKPRFCVFRSASHIYAQLIDDEKGRTLIAASDREIKKTDKKDKKTIAGETGKLIAERAIKAKIEKVVFDRGGYLYHGRLKSLADGAREAGLKF
ncbi:MAG: 50S ribosomal protein L18 [Candidatus Nealsonbacteria bacterium CG08_land_8_20_14_0_20_43_11]|uniref:Large ribosomal subunit protein uL18 n=1 Tax=Candidatus Nealsonbacteria bacterium CG08_land_8_20_14_0_20_43_11 TaxID=1974706 RepID=A0A2M6T0E6_9BACT|nr:MAG: 50S ribosomal protein L18 [Candidatus Nealsonbacteria bacterium CG08_land_8_20_14_0_20_43_11]